MQVWVVAVANFLPACQLDNKQGESSMSSQAAEAPIVNAWSTKSTVPFFRVGNYAPIFDELTTAFDKTTHDGQLIVLQAARYPELSRDDGATGFDAVTWS
jgi:hypothetical protein